MNPKLPQSDPKDLQSLRTEVKNIPSDVLDQDFAELANEIRFLENQVRVDLESYSPEELKKEPMKRSLSSTKESAILKTELSHREP